MGSEQVSGGEVIVSEGQQIWLNVGDLLRNQVPDSDGKTVPPDVMSGSYELRDLDHEVLGLLYEGKLVVDKTYGHASYGCGHCCGYSSGRLFLTPFGAPPNIDKQNTYQAYNACTSRYDDFDYAFSPYSSNTGVATLSAGLSLHTVAVGGATTSGKNTVQYGISGGCPDVDMPDDQGDLGKNADGYGLQVRRTSQCSRRVQRVPTALPSQQPAIQPAGRIRGPP